jgi:hypothetical protein
MLMVSLEERSCRNQNSCLASSRMDSLDSALLSLDGTVSLLSLSSLSFSPCFVTLSFLFLFPRQLFPVHPDTIFSGPSFGNKDTADDSTRHNPL